MKLKSSRFVMGAQPCCFCYFKSLRKHILCSVCREQLLNRLNSRSCFGRREGQWFHSYLIRWTDQELAQKLLMSLKGGGAQQAFLDLAWAFLSNSDISFSQSGSLVYPTKKDKYDHGYYWAWALSQHLGYDRVPIQKIGTKPQKVKSKSERRSIEFEKVFISGAVYFVDDIVTSGATARSVYKALGRPKNFTIGSIFHRPCL